VANLGDALRKLQAAPAASAAPSARAPLIEIFHSVQGEGRFVGVPMTFVRVATCPIRCKYCDTPNSYTASERFPVRSVRELQEPNPVSAERAAELVRTVFTAAGTAGKTPRVSVTGGEPLVFPAFVRELGRAVRGKGARLHLETAALDPAALQQCVDQVDHLSADYKLPVTLSDGKDHGAAHLQCCQIAIARGASVDVKVVLTAEVDDLALERAFTVLQPVRDKVLLVLQPVTPFGVVTKTVAKSDLERFTALAVRSGFDVRVLPQVHRALGVP